MKKYFLNGLGNALLDLQYNVDDTHLESLNLQKSGMTLVKHEKQQKIIDGISKQFVKKASGGSVANTIACLAALKVPTALTCLIGDDVFGHDYYSELHSLGVFLPNEKLPNKQTGTSLVMITPDAQRTMSTCLGVNEEYSASTFHKPTIESSEWIYLEVYLLAQENARIAIKEILEFAQKCDTKIALTLSDSFFCNLYRNDILEILPYCNLVFANIHEAEELLKANSSEKKSLETICQNLKELVPNFALTMGADGAILNLQNEMVQAPADKVLVLDTTGAGDCFAAGIFYGISKNLPPKKTLEIANRLGGQVVSQFGARMLPRLA